MFSLKIFSFDVHICFVKKKRAQLIELTRFICLSLKEKIVVRQLFIIQLQYTSSGSKTWHERVHFAVY